MHKSETRERVRIVMIKRVLKSFFNVSGANFKCNLQYKAILLLNLIKKGLFQYIFGSSIGLTNWRFDDCIIHVKFEGLNFNFFCSKDKTFNIFMNPYFHEYDISMFILDVLEEGDTFIDIGAMGGLYSIIASKLVGNKGTIISVEPLPDNLFVLQKNIKLNDLTNITLFKKAVGEINRKITLYYDKESTELTSTFKGERKNTLETELVTLDTLIETELIVKILKIDTEGYDEKVLEGASRVLQKTHYVIVETNNEIIRKLLVQSGFICKTMHPSNYVLGTRIIGTNQLINRKT